MVLRLLFVEENAERMEKETEWEGVWCSTSRNIDPGGGRGGRGGGSGETLKVQIDYGPRNSCLRAINEFFSRQFFFFFFSILSSFNRPILGKKRWPVLRPTIYRSILAVSRPPSPSFRIASASLYAPRDGYLLNARVPFVPAVYDQLRTTSTKFHVSLGQIEFARPRKRPSRSQSPVPSILTILASRNSIIKYAPPQHPNRLTFSNIPYIYIYSIKFN